jgi:hypothetical protein
MLLQSVEASNFGARTWCSARPYVNTRLVGILGLEFPDELQSWGENKGYVRSLVRALMLYTEQTGVETTGTVAIA